MAGVRSRAGPRRARPGRHPQCRWSLAAEGLALLPTSFPNATWTDDDDPDTAVGTTTIGGEQESVRLRVGPEGQLRDVLLQRWGNPDGQPYGRYPFGG